MGMLKAKVGADWVPVSAGGGSSGGTGTDEVWVGPDDPIVAAPTIELWYDSDAAAPSFDETMRWNTAWGQITKVALTTTFTTTAPHTTAQSTGLTATIAETAGRRLKITTQTSPYPAGADNGMAFRVMRNGVVQEQWYIPADALDPNTSFPLTHVFTLDAVGGSATYTLELFATTTNTAVADFGAGAAPRMMLIEDIGPVGGAAMVPNPITPADRWNTAWGVAAVGSFVPADGGTLAANASLTSTINLTALQGRRYRLTCLVRAITQQGSPAGYTGVFFALYDKGVQGPDRYNVYPIPSQGYANFHSVWVFNGDGAAHSWDVRNSGTPLTVFPQSGAIWMVEDIGPIGTYVASTPPFPAWTPVTFQNGWSDYEATRNVRYRIIGDLVYIQGLMKGGTMTYNTPAFTLPAGYRPRADTAFPSLMNGGIANVWIAANGVVSVAPHPGASSGATNAYVYMDLPPFQAVQ
jgi:hypothetical protein